MYPPSSVSRNRFKIAGGGQMAGVDDSPTVLQSLSAVAQATVVLLELLIAWRILDAAQRLRIRTPLLTVMVALFLLLQAAAAFSTVQPWTSTARAQLVLHALTALVLLVMLRSAGQFAEGLAGAADPGRVERRAFVQGHDHTVDVLRMRTHDPLTMIKSTARTIRAEALSDNEIRADLCEVIISTVEHVEEIVVRPDRRLERSVEEQYAEAAGGYEGGDRRFGD